MKKNIVLLAALCAANGAFAVMQPTTIINGSPTHGISVSGAAGKFYTLAAAGKKSVTVLSLGRKVSRGSSLDFESGVQNNLIIRLGSVNPTTYQFVESRTEYHYDLKIIKYYFAHVRSVTFNSNGTLTLVGTLSTIPSAFDNGNNLAKRCADKDNITREKLKCDVISRPPDPASTVASATVTIYPQ